jgi:hypothetical protein
MSIDPTNQKLNILAHIIKLYKNATSDAVDDISTNLNNVYKKFIDCSTNDDIKIHFEETTCDEDFDITQKLHNIQLSIINNIAFRKYIINIFENALNTINLCFVNVSNIAISVQVSIDELINVLTILPRSLRTKHNSNKIDDLLQTIINYSHDANAEMKIANDNMNLLESIKKSLNLVDPNILKICDNNDYAQLCTCLKDILNQLIVCNEQLALWN